MAWFARLLSGVRCGSCAGVGSSDILGSTRYDKRLFQKRPRILNDIVSEVHVTAFGNPSGGGLINSVLGTGDVRFSRVCFEHLVPANQYVVKRRNNDAWAVDVAHTVVLNDKVTEYSGGSQDCVGFFRHNRNRSCAR